MPPPSPPENVRPGVEKVRGTATAAQVKTEAGEDDGGLINVKRNVKLRRLMDMYCGKHSLDPKAVLFLDAEGRHIRPAQTPDDVGLKDGDEIDILLKQDGGGGAPLHATCEPDSCVKAAVGFRV
ncbi:small ubiquitin-related modifier 1-like [Setaria viridis]|uniref:small ubiquitin-related modifier 1-like n=1 Tax=Setaria viridis TaxID=4556 RepID=UPI0014934553|nr:small ubiquitin-related modifier 1-like [Setaria viridis]